MSRKAWSAASLPIVVVLWGVLATRAEGQTIVHEPTRGVPTFAVREPVLRLKPGAIVETRTFSKPGDYYDPEKAGPWPGEVGAFYLEGAAPGDTLGLPQASPPWQPPVTCWPQGRPARPCVRKKDGELGDEAL